jgi:hypothetical protein
MNDIFESEQTKQARLAIDDETVRRERIRVARERLDLIQKKEERERKERLAIALKNYNDCLARTKAALEQVQEAKDIPTNLKRAVQEIGRVAIEAAERKSKR